jgi:hypothetical protein
MFDRVHGQIVTRLNTQHGSEAVAAQCLPGRLAKWDETKRHGVQQSIESLAALARDLGKFLHQASLEHSFGSRGLSAAARLLDLEPALSWTQGGSSIVTLTLGFFLAVIALICGVLMLFSGRWSRAPLAAIAIICLALNESGLLSSLAR